MKEFFRREFICLTFAIALNEFILRVITGIGFSLWSLFFTATYLVVMWTMISFLKNKKIPLVIFVVVHSVYCLSQCWYHAFFGGFYSFRSITLAGELTGVSSEVMSKWNWAFLLFLVPILTMLSVKPVKQRASRKQITQMSVVAFLAFVILNVSVFCGFAFKGNRHILNTVYGIRRTNSSAVRYISRVGTLDYAMKELSSIRLVKNKKMLSEAELAELATFNDCEIEANERTGQFAGYNLIMILGESWDFIDEKLTPTLYRLTKEGWYWPNYYAPLFQSHTNDSEFISQTGILPSTQYGTTSYEFGTNAFPEALAFKFQNSNSYHSYISAFYNRQVLHKSLGFNHFYDMEELGLKEEEGSVETVNWILDSDLMKKVVERTNLSEPFYDFIISVSGHMPYVKWRFELQQYYDEAKETYPDTDEELLWYYASQMEFDRSIETLISLMGEEMDRTVLVIYGDHYPYGLNTEEYYAQFDKEYQKFAVPLIIYNPNMQGETFTTLASTFDIYPTVINLFGLESSWYHVGNDLFSSDYRFVLFPDGSVLTEDFYCDASTGKTETFTSDEKLNETLETVKDIIQKGNLILASDYYSLKVGK